MRIGFEWGYVGLSELEGRFTFCAAILDGIRNGRPPFSVLMQTIPRSKTLLCMSTYNIIFILCDQIYVAIHNSSVMLYAHTATSKLSA